ncbi:hypothetical protein M427DRAFT_429959 [Gonapodya prolifera JEL478]|uniref:Uncharacterized protein n=1 Tax=Gonapodya prolifera (strain JEL478) TaxID=1344416 RepID=A0A139ASR8_GONPJ|nr:hypothetical protein M427DRAFT_429959 [Gonapodya prolifera JEL478]|eukprot:KXS19787.1 hypothetical protein M427DRAFT_429959 [Gonapodya prolifera JEL478]
MVLKANFRQLTFLHVYHHVTVFIMAWVGCLDASRRRLCVQCLAQFCRPCCDVWILLSLDAGCETGVIRQALHNSTTTTSIRQISFP